MAAPHPPDGAGGVSERSRQWAATMAGQPGPDGVRLAHTGGARLRVGPVATADREAREAHEAVWLAPGATTAAGSGHRAVAEVADPYRTCFERDRDRVLHSSAFRRLAGKTQVFIFPADHQRTRLTHALEVAQVATAIAAACRLNVALTEAIALAHDCGHGPGGHASEDAFADFVPGFDHAVWGADVTAAPLNLCRETLDGIRNHSWSRPSPSTPEGQVVGVADRVAYCAHDLEDAVSAGLVDPGDLPPVVLQRCGGRRAEQLRAWIADATATIGTHGVVGLSEGMAEALAALRAFNHERIYLRPESRAQGHTVVAMLRALVEHYASHPGLLPSSVRETGDPVQASVAWVDGMTDRFACQQAVSLLGWDADRLPRGQDVA